MKKFILSTLIIITSIVLSSCTQTSNFVPSELYENIVEQCNDLDFQCEAIDELLEIYHLTYEATIGIIYSPSLLIHDIIMSEREGGIQQLNEHAIELENELSTSKPINQKQLDTISYIILNAKTNDGEIVLFALGSKKDKRYDEEVVIIHKMPFNVSYDA